MWPKKYGVGVALVQEGHACDKMYVIMRGEAVSTIKSGFASHFDTTSDVRRLQHSSEVIGTVGLVSTSVPHPLVGGGSTAGVIRLGPGAWLGEHAASDPTEFSCETVVTTSPVEVLELSRVVITKKMPGENVVVLHCQIILCCVCLWKFHEHTVAVPPHTRTHECALIYFV